MITADSAICGPGRRLRDRARPRGRARQAKDQPLVAVWAKAKAFRSSAHFAATPCVLLAMAVGGTGP
eukprot:5843845-Lingulodinium_polyedra.AAC.1